MGWLEIRHPDGTVESYGDKPAYMHDDDYVCPSTGLAFNKPIKRPGAGFRLPAGHFDILRNKFDWKAEARCAIWGSERFPVPGLHNSDRWHYLMAEVIPLNKPLNWRK